MQTQEEIYRHLRDLRNELGVVSGRYGEISDGEIVMMMSPVPMHAYIARSIARQLDAQLPPPLGAFENADTDDAALGKLRIPDVLVVPEDAMKSVDPLDPHEISLAVEIVSRSNPNTDYVDKVADYPAMGIPHYLIIDPRDGTARHHWQIATQNGHPAYLNQVSYSFGDKIRIGDWTIDTADLPRYSDDQRPA
ncbi:MULTISPECIES: Uma2 family endonuclease [Streptacidiphilus]|uniref:Uma2 family endonuclease n=1 Tax=Streptacidiphilus cavernicola TaxID=3342716 RepID=A0ABV6UID1_9ACTN|nr:Uma2 family endonuclease [Streptacidiphilus jeojiense]